MCIESPMNDVLYDVVTSRMGVVKIVDGDVNITVLVRLSHVESEYK